MLFSLENIQFTPYSIIYGQIEDVFLQKFHFRNRLFVYRRLLMVGTKSRGYSNSGRLSEGEYSMPFFSTRYSPSIIDLSVCPSAGKSGGGLYRASLSESGQHPTRGSLPISRQEHRAGVSCHLYSLLSRLLPHSQPEVGLSL